MKKTTLTLLIVLGVSCMLFGKDSGNWKKYESLKKDDFSINEKYWKKYKGISKELANEIPAERLYEVVDNYVAWIIGNSYDTEMDKKLQKLPLAIKYAYLVYTYECEINNGGFDQFYFNSIGYEVFELQKGLEFFGLIKNKMLLDKSLELLKQKYEPILRLSSCKKFRKRTWCINAKARCIRITQFSKSTFRLFFLKYGLKQY